MRCMSYVMGKRIEERGGFNFDREAGREDESIWARLKDVFESTYEVLNELAEEQGIDVEDIYAAENIDREFWGDDYEAREQGRDCDAMIEASDIIRMCAIYEHLGDKCLEKLFEITDEKPENQCQTAINEPLEVVSWYLDLIQAKMRRALHGYYFYSKGSKKGRDDFNGSAKVALLSIDCSIENWKKVQSGYPGYQKEISHLLVILQQLQVDVELQFPEARTFLRPGFEIPEIPV